jgi:GNAT superfamily N-acetyltransferase
MPDGPNSNLTIRFVRGDEREDLARFIRTSWGSSTITSRGVAHDASLLTCLVAADGERWLGLAIYQFDGDECELVLLEAFEKHRGIGTALLEATIEQARKLNSRRLWLVTTNDNLDALRFYQRRDMHISRLWRTQPPRPGRS